MGQLAKRAATYDDILALREGLVGEILHGSLHVQPRPAPKYAAIASSLGVEVGGPYHRGHGGPGGWWILDEPELHLGSDVLVPDLAGWRRERMPALPEAAWFELAPDWVCEVLSPRTARTDRVIKMPLYASHGVRHLWLIDPDLKILEAYELAGAHWMLIASLGDDAEVRIPPFDATGFILESLWS